MIDQAAAAMLSSEPYPLPGEIVVYSPGEKNEHFGCSFVPSVARIYVTNTRLAAFRVRTSQAYVPGAPIPARFTGSLEDFYRTIELDEIDAIQTFEVDGFPTVAFAQGQRGRVELRLKDETTYRIGCEDPAQYTALSEALRTALASRVPLISFSDPGETVLYKGGERGVTTLDPLWGLCGRVFAFGGRTFSAEFKLCITNKRILLYRVEFLHMPPQGVGNAILLNYGQPTVQWIQIATLQDVCQIQVRRTFFPFPGQQVRLRVRRRAPFGCVPQAPSLTIRSEEEVFSPSSSLNVLLDERLLRKMDRHGYVDLLLTGASPTGAQEASLRFGVVLATLRRLFPQLTC